MIYSAYIVQTNIIPLGDTPLHPSPHLRKIFHDIFKNTDCFADMRFSFPQEGKKFGALEFAFPSQPFIRDIGQVYFDTRSIRVGRPRTNTARLRLAALLAKKEEFWNPSRSRNEKTVQIENKNRFFGYEHRINDQRLNYLHFQTKPLHIKAIYENRTIADGKLLIHLYPSGFVVIHLAVSIKSGENLNIENISQFTKECYPSRYDGAWTWDSRVAKGKLPDVVKAIKNKISASLFTEAQAQLEDGTWYSTIKLITTLDANSLSPTLTRGQFTSFDLGLYKWKKGGSNEAMIVSRQGLICLLSPFRKRISSTHFLWSIIYLYHFILIKSQVYDSYANYLNRETERLREYRLSPISKFTKEDLRKLFVYDPLIPKYLNALDRFIQPAPPFYRRVYAAISDGTAFNEKRNKMLETVKNWESEVEQWEHPVAAAWNKLISPLRSLLGL